ncbi:Uncharacterised protein [Shigella sonnei]|nr:Uncharacterised protein [Shigella sonnei]CSP44645.1 Uncharacterised protein [Shigella sonnei]
MSGTAFSIARKFNANNFSVGGFYRFISGHNVWPCANTRTQNANGTIALFKFHRVQQGAINVRNDQTYSVANSGANKFC